MKDRIGMLIVTVLLVGIGGFFLWPFVAGWLMGANPEGGIIRAFANLGLGGTIIIGVYQLMFAVLGAYGLVLLWRKPQKLYHWAKAVAR